MSTPWDKVRTLYEGYHNDVGFLIIDVELRYNEFPTQVLNEIRAFTTHVSRIAINHALDDAQIEEQIRRAQRHIFRIKLDLLKILIVWYIDEFSEKFNEEYKYSTIEDLIIGGRRFDTIFSTLMHEAAQNARQAKLIEINGPAEDAVPVYLSAILKYQELEALINENRVLLNENKIRNNQKITDAISAEVQKVKKADCRNFFLGILTSLLASIPFAIGNGMNPNWVILLAAASIIGVLLLTETKKPTKN